MHKGLGQSILYKMGGEGGGEQYDNEFLRSSQG